jgi:1-acyl-sn-glycerol-3-phosphate acyltransferase
MQNSITFLRSLLFYIISILWTLVLSFGGIAAFIVNNKALILEISKLWANGVIKLLDLICGLKVKIMGVENIKKQPVIIAAKHQSALETLVIYSLLDEAKFVLKDSLRFIPILGQFFIKLNMIFIDRKKPIKSLKQIKEKSSNLLVNGSSIIIFPEGTRTAYGSKGKYGPGIASLYELGYPVIPVAVNTGKYWARNSMLKGEGECFIKFLSPIMPDLSKDEFMDKLELAIESNCTK